jgi:hypothetical protein
MAQQPCPQCGRAIAEEELLCPHCGAAQIPQYTRTELSRAMGHAREGPSKAPPALGCGLGLLLGVALVLVLFRGEPAGAGDWQRLQLQAEIVFLLMLGGGIAGLLFNQVRALRRRRSARRGAGVPPADVSRRLPKAPP